MLVQGYGETFLHCASGCLCPLAGAGRSTYPQSSRMKADHVRCDFRLGGELNIRLSDRIMCLVGWNRVYLMIGSRTIPWADEDH